MQKVTITVDEKTVHWIVEEVAKKRFRNASHGFEFAVNELMQKEKGQ
jgi:Arc/MetJ-type ribon-helix-helix transcriptional regulator